MITLLGGAAAGSYAVRRAPLFLRATVTQDGDRDVLDQIDDKPVWGERIHIYVRVTKAGTVHINMGRRPGTGFYATGSYLPVDGVDNADSLRDNQVWQVWAQLQLEGLKAGTLKLDQTEEHHAILVKP